MYHTWWLPFILGAFGVCTGCMRTIIHTADQWESSPAATGAVMLATLTLLSAGVSLCALVIHRRAVAPLHALQREVAVSIARDEIRKKLAHPHKHLLG